MTLFYKISEVQNNGILYVHNHADGDNDNMYFDFRGEIEADMTKPDTTDYGQIWAINENPKNRPAAQSVYNTYSQSLLGTLGVKAEYPSGELVGGVSFLSTRYNGTFLFTVSATIPNAFTINLVDLTGVPTNDYICYFTNTGEVGITNVANITTPPQDVQVSWYIKELQNSIIIDNN